MTRGFKKAYSKTRRSKVDRVIKACLTKGTFANALCNIFNKSEKEFPLLKLGEGKVLSGLKTYTWIKADGTFITKSNEEIDMTVKARRHGSNYANQVISDIIYNK